MNSDLDIDEKRASAPPYFFPEDFDKPAGYSLNPCEKCLRLFRGLPKHRYCKECDE